MIPKSILCLALVLSGGLLGCSTATKITATKLIESPDTDPRADNLEVITDLGTGFSIRTAEDSWPALVQKDHPAFAWNGRDMIWIEPGKHGQPQFILDEAYLYQPTNQPRQWVLLEIDGRKITAWRPFNLSADTFKFWEYLVYGWMYAAVAYLLPAAIARTLPGCYPANVRTIHRTLAMLRRMLRGHCTGTDWPRTGHGLYAAADIVPDIRQHRLGRHPSIAGRWPNNTRLLPGHSTG